jgi:2-amino-4-hydroxy-6-hydroxymethyldihydropteridine diphosphokinase
MNGAPSLQRPSPDLDQMVVIALGGNLPGAYGSAEEALEAAFVALERAALRVLRRSSIWRSAAWPRPQDPPFVNAVALLEPPPVSPLALLARLKALELQFGPRAGPKNGPRVLDLDVIAFGRRKLTSSALVLPHPRAAERFFVQGPLAEIAPDWRDPSTGRSASALAASASVGRDAWAHG